MPELIEVEFYRRLADRAVGREIVRVDVPDEWYLKGGTEPAALDAALLGSEIAATRRIGKLLLLDIDSETGSSSEVGPGSDAGGSEPRGEHTLGLRFGMTGRLIVDDIAAMDRLEYATARDEPADRFGLAFADGGVLRVQDPRRLGGVELDPDERRLGVDAVGVGPAALRDLLAGADAPLKARLLDQARIAGIGNLLVDETLWRAGLDPARAAGSLRGPEVRRLARHLQETVAELTERGGSHTGDLHERRSRGSVCPRDGAPLERRTIGGRTTYSCPKHQR